MKLFKTASWHCFETSELKPVILDGCTSKSCKYNLEGFSEQKSDKGNKKALWTSWCFCTLMLAAVERSALAT